MLERKRRSLAKVISWRITATLTTTIISYFVIGNIDVALKIGAVELLVKIYVQYLHERIWNKLKFGLTPIDYQI